MIYLSALNFKKDNLNTFTTTLNSLGNFFSTPLRYLYNERSADCILTPYGLSRMIPGYRGPRRDSDGNRATIYKPYFVNIKNIQDQDSPCVKCIKTIAVIISIIPGVFLFMLTKGVALICSERLRRRHETFNDEVKTLNEKALHELQFGISKKNPENLRRFLGYLQTEENQNNFIQDYKDLKIHQCADVVQAINFNPVDLDSVQKLLKREITPEVFLQEAQSSASGQDQG